MFHDSKFSKKIIFSLLMENEREILAIKMVKKNQDKRISQRACPFIKLTNQPM